MLFFHLETGVGEKRTKNFLCQTLVKIRIGSFLHNRYRHHNKPT